MLAAEARGAQAGAAGSHFAAAMRSEEPLKAQDAGRAARAPTFTYVTDVEAMQSNSPMRHAFVPSPAAAVPPPAHPRDLAGPVQRRLPSPTPAPAQSCASPTRAPPAAGGASAPPATAAAKEQRVEAEAVAEEPAAGVEVAEGQPAHSGAAGRWGPGEADAAVGATAVGPGHPELTGARTKPPVLRFARCSERWGGDM